MDLTEMNDLVIDLCCGKGRFPGGNVISVDIDRKTKPTILADIRFLPFKSGIHPKLCHASPPCTYVSKARRWGWGWNPKGIAESLRLLSACYDAFAYLEPETCTLEQPAGLEDFLGVKLTFKYDKADLKNYTTNFYSNNKGLKRAMIPQDIRQKILVEVMK